MSYQIIWDKNAGTKQGSLPNLTQGGTMTGLLTLSAAPTADLHAATKKFAEDEAAAAQAAPAVLSATLAGGESSFVASTPDLTGTYAILSAYTTSAGTKK